MILYWPSILLNRQVQTVASLIRLYVLLERLKTESHVLASVKIQIYGANVIIVNNEIGISIVLQIKLIRNADTIWEWKGYLVIVSLRDADFFWHT